MASIILDLTLCQNFDDGSTETLPGSPERAKVVSQILEAAGADETRVKFRVLNEHGPGGGNPECEFSGPRDEIAKVVAWAIADMGEFESWADEYWTDRS